MIARSRERGATRPAPCLRLAVQRSRVVWSHDAWRQERRGADRLIRAPPPAGAGPAPGRHALAPAVSPPSHPRRPPRRPSGPLPARAAHRPRHRRRAAGAAATASRPSAASPGRRSCGWPRVLVVVGGVLGAGLRDGFGSEASAGADRAGVPARLAAGQVRAGGRADRRRGRRGAARSSRPPTPISTRATRSSPWAASPSTATPRSATFKATVDLAQAGKQWSYTGTFGLSARGGHWVVNWAPPSSTRGWRLVTGSPW